MNDPSEINPDLLISSHPEEFYKDDWVLSRKSMRAGGLIIDHHIEPPDEIEVGITNYHILGYLLSDFAPRQVTRIDGKEYDGINKKGDIWLKPATCGGFWHWESNDEALIFTIEPAFLRKVAAENDCPNADALEIQPVVHKSDRDLDNLVTMFMREMNHANLGNILVLESLVDLFMVHLLRNYCTFPAKTGERSEGLAPGKLKRAIEYINDNLNHSITVSQIAETIDISQYYFSREFKKSTGLTPHEYVVTQRILKAKELLKDEKLSMEEIVHHCGFTHQSHMGKLFRKHIGTTPKRYRNEMLR